MKININGNHKNSVVITAIIALLIIQILAIKYGINGGLRTLIVGVIAGLAGWRIPIGNK